MYSQLYTNIQRGGDLYQIELKNLEGLPQYTVSIYSVQDLSFSNCRVFPKDSGHLKALYQRLRFYSFTTTQEGKLPAEVDKKM